MVESAPKPFWSGWVKVAGLALAGGLTGFVMALTVGRSFSEGGALAGVADAEPALLVAALYAIMGVFVVMGSLSPRVGAAILNVEDADEVREQAPVMVPSAIACLLAAISLAALALGGEGGFLAPAVAGSIAIAALAIATFISLAATRKSDELMRALFRESGSASFYLLSSVLFGWAAAAHLSLVRLPSAIELLALVFAAPLAASFWVIGRRGLLMPRA